MLAISKRPKARSDLIEIWDYIADDSEARADAFIDRIDEVIRSLALSPYIGRSREELAEGLRSFPVERYVIFYRVATIGIEIVRVLHGSRDINPFFFLDEDSDG